MTEEGLFDVAIWGTVGQWVSAIGTIGLGVVSLFLASRGEKRARDLAARQIINSVSFTARRHQMGGGAVRVINAGTTPVHDLRIPYVAFDLDGNEVDAYYPTDSLLPGDRDGFDLDDFAYNCSPDFTLDLTDIHGRRWRKTLGGDVIELTPTKPGRMKRRWRWIVGRPSAIRSRLKK